MSDYNLNTPATTDMASLLPNGLISNDDDWRPSMTTMNHRVPEFVPSSYQALATNALATNALATNALATNAHDGSALVNSDPTFSSPLNHVMNGFGNMQIHNATGGGGNMQIHNATGGGGHPMDGSGAHHLMGAGTGHIMGAGNGPHMNLEGGVGHHHHHHMASGTGHHMGGGGGAGGPHMGGGPDHHMGGGGGGMNHHLMGAGSVDFMGAVGHPMAGAGHFIGTGGHQMGVADMNDGGMAGGGGGGGGVSDGMTAHSMASQSTAGPVSSNYVAVNTIMADGGHKHGVTSLAFDVYEELLWMGNGGGHITSYYGAGLQKYTSFQIAPKSDTIVQLLPIENSVLALSNDGVISRQRTGMPIWVFKSGNISQAQAMLQMDPATPTVVISGHDPSLVEFDFNAKKETRILPLADGKGRVILRRSQKYLMAGDPSGKITMHDPRSLRQEQAIEVHSGSLSDFDVHGTTLATVGFAARGPSPQNMFSERFIKLYDLRFMRGTSPVQVHVAPQFLRCLPLFSSANFLILSQHGQFQIVEPSGLATSSQVSNAGTQGMHMTCLDVSSNYSAIAFGDSMGLVHLFTNSGNMIDPSPFNVYSRPTTFADPVESYPPIPFTDIMTPLSVIPMPVTNTNLVSDWPNFLTEKTYRVPEPIHPELLENLKMVQGIGYAARPPWMTRNMNVSQPKQNDSSQRKPGPLGRPNQNSISPQDRWSPYASAVSNGNPPVTIPKRYQKVELKYSKIGLEDFDFRLYNKTSFAGLETDIPNSYCNSMLQVLYFLEPLRCCLLRHICTREFCISCELSFLFHMLDITKGNTCQANNFLRAFRTIPEAAALGLILADADEETGKANLPQLIQSWNRFILQQIYSETTTPAPDLEKRQQQQQQQRLQQQQQQQGSPSRLTGGDTPASSADAAAGATRIALRDDIVKETSPEVRPDNEPPVNDISRLFSMRTMNIFTCRSGCQVTKETSTMVTALSYPDCFPDGDNAPPRQFHFVDVVKRSLDYSHNVTAFCDKCQKYMPTTQQRRPISIPDNLTLNCQVVTGKDLRFWKVQTALLNPIEYEPEAREAAMPPVDRSVAACKFGARCKRADCRYRHDNATERPSQETRRKESFIPREFKVRIHPRTKELQLKISNPGFDEVEEGAEDRAEMARDAEEDVYDPGQKWPMGGGWETYELGGNIVHIHDKGALKPGGGLVAHIFVGEKAHKRTEGITSTQWYVFNDFSIEPIEEHEARVLDLDFMTPVCIFFRRKNMERTYDLPLTYDSPITRDVLSDTRSIAPTASYLRDRHGITFQPLLMDEIVDEKYLVGLDAEFVTLNQEESEIRSDGTKSTLKPSQMLCARITCVRGSGPLEGIPLIDDYISTQEQVVDYLTEFSGIKPGDLDANISCKHLTTLKSSYLKLRYLVSRGVVFVGHGLKKDFRVINLVVPKDQIIDTVTLFHMPKQRNISLKFLAWYILGISIQEDTHDSIEDSRTALKLYIKYKDFAQDTIGLQDYIKNLYEEGRKYGWKVPT